jgi:hypothetical protein
MADLLMWKDSEGYDIHVLRGMPASKALDESLNLDANGVLPSFKPHFTGAPDNPNLGVSVNTSTGEVTAAAQNPPSRPQLPDFNFLMTARQVLVGSQSETMIRIHIHDSIKKIWLTPKTLTVHQDADNARLTVLALFGDDTVGDITEWPQLNYDVPSLSGMPDAARRLKVLNTGETFKGEAEPFGGRLWARPPPPGDDNPNPSFDVTVTLKSSSPPIDLSATAKVFVKPSWIDLAKDAKTIVEWVAGPFKFNPNDFDSEKPDCIKSVFGRANVLFVSDGFTSESDFRQKVVKLTVNELRTEPDHEPFKVLSKSINYWAVFVPSTDEGISILGDNEISSTRRSLVADTAPLPAPPAQPQWAIGNMIHEAGLPLPHDAPVASEADWPASRTSLFDIPPGVSVNKQALSDWNDLKQRTLLNERDTAFGMAHYDRPRASGQGLGSEEHLLHDPRRISVASIQDFVENLQFSGFPIGANWEQSKPDFGRVCFACRSDRTGGTAVDNYFTASTGQAAGADVTLSTIAGTDVTPDRLNLQITIYASVVSHEFGHALHLGDEYGGNDKYDPNIHPIPSDPNLQPDTLLFPLSSNADKIKWLWPRVSKAGVLDGPPDFQGDPDPVQFLVRLRKGDGKPFAKGDLVRIRESPVRRGASSDPFAGILLQIDLPVTGDVISVTYVEPSGPHVDLSLFNPSKTLILICTSIQPKTEFLLVSRRILNVMIDRNGPLTMPRAGQPCVVGTGSTVMSPKDLPKLSNGPKNSADIVGLYEGGGHHDCGVFRPAGRCRMRSGFNATIPFCHVCRYLIVDAVDPTKHGDLDSKLYDKVYPA